MNLAIEYMLRVGELKQKLEFPYSLFVNCRDNNNKMVITIYESFRRDRLAVKHWKLAECNETMTVPPFTEYEIHRSELFVSDKIIIPGYFPLWYLAQPFRAGKTQHPDPPLAREDEHEYQEKLDNFLNSKHHKQARTDWLWRSFTSVYNVELKGFVSTRKDSQLGILKQFAPSLVSHWVRWRRYFLDHSMRLGQPASELLFQKEYMDLAKKEERPVHKPDPTYREHTIIPRITINNSGSAGYSTFYQPTAAFINHFV